MKLPIPNDWNGQDWVCIQIEWPDSPQWIGIFSGLITSIMRGRLWDENTGLITGAQSIGDEIYEKNFPFNLCDSNSNSGGSVGDAGSIDFAMAVCDAIERGINSMTLCGYNPKAFRFDSDGTLQVKDFCGDWVDIAGQSGLTSENPPVEGYDFDDTTGNLSACGKAWALATKMVEIAAYFWDNSDNSVYPLIEKQAENATGVELKTAYAGELWALTLAHKGLRTSSVGVIPLDRENVIPEDITDKLACLMAPTMNQDVFEADGNAIDSLFENSLSRVIPASDIDGVAAQAWWYVVKAMVGKSKMLELANMGAYDVLQDCDNCDTVVNPPTLGGNVFWQTGMDVVLEGQGAMIEGQAIQSPYEQWVTVVGGQNSNFQEVHWRLFFVHPGGTVGELEITIDLRQTSDVPDYFLAEVWNDTNPTPQAEYIHPVVELVATPDSIAYNTSANKVVCIFKWDTPINLDAAKLFMATKINPKNQSVTVQRFRSRITITYSGDQR